MPTRDFGTPLGRGGEDPHRRWGEKPGRAHEKEKAKSLSKKYKNRRKVVKKKDSRSKRFDRAMAGAGAQLLREEGAMLSSDPVIPSVKDEDNDSVVVIMSSHPSPQ